MNIFSFICLYVASFSFWVFLLFLSLLCLFINSDTQEPVVSFSQSISCQHEIWILSCLKFLLICIVKCKFHGERLKDRPQYKAFLDLEGENKQRKGPGLSIFPKASFVFLHSSLQKIHGITLLVLHLNLFMMKICVNCQCRLSPSTIRLPWQHRDLGGKERHIQQVLSKKMCWKHQREQ